MSFRFHRQRHSRHGERHFMRHEHGHWGGRGGPLSIRGRRGGFGAQELRTGRKLGSAGLQLIILALLKDRPRHGYEIIKALEERSGGFYAPSPGMVYPALTYLEEIGHAVVEAEGAKKLYRITPTGEAEFDKNREEAEALLARFDEIAKKMEQVREAVDEDGEGAPEIHAARRALKSAVREKRGASREELQRVAAILERAAAEIREPEKK